MIEAFVKAMEAQAGQVYRLGKIEGAVDTISKILGQATEIVAAPALQSIDWGAWSPEFRPGKITDRVGVTRAIAGIAETGTLVFASDADNPPSLNFVPEVSFAVLYEKEIVAAQEDVWAILAKPIPATINLITGPSRTGDIEQTLYLGAHGPKELHVLLIKA